MRFVRATCVGKRAHPGAGGGPPYRQAACSPAMGRSTAQLSAPQAAVLLAVLALSAAVPGTAALDRPKEAGPTRGCATVDRTVWPDVPKEALAIFDMSGFVSPHLLFVPYLARFLLALIRARLGYFGRVH